MVIYIEGLVIFIIILMLFSFGVWFFLTRYISRRRYKTEDDRGYQGEENRKRLIAEGKSDPAKSIIDDARSTEPPRPSILSTTKINDIGEADTSTRKTSEGNGGPSKRFRNPFRRKC